MNAIKGLIARGIRKLTEPPLFVAPPDLPTMAARILQSEGIDFEAKAFEYDKPPGVEARVVFVVWDPEPVEPPFALCADFLRKDDPHCFVSLGCGLRRPPAPLYLHYLELGCWASGCQRVLSPSAYNKWRQRREDYCHLYVTTEFDLNAISLAAVRHGRTLCVHSCGNFWSAGAYKGTRPKSPWRVRPQIFGGRCWDPATHTLSHFVALYPGIAGFDPSILWLRDLLNADDHTRRLRDIGLPMSEVDTSGLFRHDWTHFISDLPADRYRPTQV